MSLPLDPHLLQLYLIAVGVLVLAPGPDSLLVLTRSVADGRQAGVVATLGISVGNLLHALLAAAGISALIAASAALFDLLRYAGGAYLAWIGLRSLWSVWCSRRAAGQAPAAPAPDEAPAGAGRVFLQALLTNLLNPKVILFQLAFVPQFIAPALGHVAFQTFVMGSIISVVGGLYLCGIAVLSAGAARRVLASPRVRTAMDAIAGVLFLGFALRLLLTDRKFA
ncbi:LysE family translocator [Azospirillum picis]|uniref:Threonine/homoserine/homoserine lactone efflux protein n=1 Tax=Azospirillum picis TaxID=488438 RepID=A0ABU0MFG7_9PROT|nr:LysE family translocator [Azospirillum picis]MBP2298292.1 threonine/homoserine/homoserine lactone efflux protein [Azospirillum picis]MDQ0532129.1 threonine/homoserine/homoserine lactone efflux protein [Azospirillum picis]